MLYLPNVDLLKELSVLAPEHIFSKRKNYIYHKNLKMELLTLYSESNIRRSNCPAPLSEITAKRKFIATC